VYLPRSIVAAVDFGEASARAVAVAGALARACAAELTLLHAEAMEAPAYFTSEQVDALERQRHALQVQAEQYLARFGRHHTTAPFAPRIDNRPPVDAILRASESADLVVMGTHGRTGAKRWWLGSVAERVLREITRPLLIVRADGPVSGAGLFDRVVVHAGSALDGGWHREYARLLARQFGGTVVEGGSDSIETSVHRTRATVAVVPAPHPRTAAWLAAEGEPLVRFCSVPVLFVPLVSEGVAS
jgi:nucleotide-binding universal stress UspA family protein